MFFASYLTILSLVCCSLQASLPSFENAISTQTNLSTFYSTLNNTYPSLLTRISNISSQNITVLAPSNSAFAKTVYYPIIGPAFSNNDIGAIKSILEYHIVQGNHPSTSLLPTFQYFPTWLTNSSFANVTGGQRCGAVMQGGKEMIWTSGQSNRSPASIFDIPFQGGTIHILDSLLIPPSSFPATAEKFDTASEPNQLTSFLGATYFLLPNDTLAGRLNTTSDITILAPNNIAMEMVSSSFENGTLSSLLNYHILPQSIYSTSFPTDNTSLVLPTLNGESVSITFASNSFFVNSARVLTTDLLLQNGVMHVLDNVLSPVEKDEKPDPKLATQVPVLSTGTGVVNVSEAPFTSFRPDRVVTGTGVGSASVGPTYGGGGKVTSTGVGSGTSTGTGTANKSGGVRVSWSGGRWVVICAFLVMIL